MAHPGFVEKMFWFCRKVTKHLHIKPKCCYELYACVQKTGSV